MVYTCTIKEIDMRHAPTLFIAIATFAAAINAVPAAAEQRCRMEQQCHWENFKKVCTYVKVCR